MINMRGRNEEREETERNDDRYTESFDREWSCEREDDHQTNAFTKRNVPQLRLRSTFEGPRNITFTNKTLLDFRPVENDLLPPVSKKDVLCDENQSETNLTECPRHK